VAGPTVFYDRFSVGGVTGRKSVREVPVEVVPTPDKIIDINRYFVKRAVLIEKKPCNLAAFL